MKSYVSTKQQETVTVVISKSTRTTKRTKWTKRATERRKNKDKYETNDMDPEWDEQRQMSRLSTVKAVLVKDSTGESPDVLKTGGGKGNIVTEKHEHNEEVEGCEDVVNPIKDVLYSCDLCQQVFTSSLSLNRHKQVHKVKQYECGICGKKFRRPSSLRKHSVFHSDDSPYKCPICGKYSTSKEGLTLHLRTHSGDKPYQCDICGRHFTQIGNLKLHKKKIHSPESVFKCDICNKEFEHNQELISHVLTHTDGQILKCYECGKMFGKKDHFEKHKELHMEMRPFSCDICGNTYKKNADLKCHLDTHDTAQGYVCDVCGRGFGYKSSLKYHLRIHTGAKPYACDICGKAFRTSSNRSKHVLSHTDYKPFSCDQCAKSFRDNRALVIHKRTHSGNRPYQCSTCFKCFIVQSELNRHRKKLHLNAIECDKINGGNIATKRRSTYSKGTKCNQREHSVDTAYSQMTYDSGKNDVTKEKIHETNTHVSVGSSGGDQVQQFSKESTTVSVPTISIVNSSHAPITTSLERNSFPRIHDDNNIGESGMTNSCQMSAIYSHANVYGYIRDVLFTANEIGSCGRDSAASPYVLPNNSLYQVDTRSAWMNDMESNSGVNASQFDQRCRNNVIEQNVQLPDSSKDVQPRGNMLVETIHVDAVSQCDSLNQIGLSLQHSEATLTTYIAPQHENIFKPRIDNSKSIENAPKHNSYCTVVVSDKEIIKDKGNSEKGSENNSSVISDICGSIQECSVDVNDGRPTHDHSPGCYVTECVSGLEVLSGVVAGLEADQSSCDGEKSTSDVQFVNVECVDIRNKYNMDEDTDIENEEFEYKRDIGEDLNDIGNEKADVTLGKRSVQWWDGSSEYLQTPVEVMHNDDNPCLESEAAVKKYVKRTTKYPKSRRRDGVKSEVTVRKGKRKTRSNSKMFACHYCDKSYSNVISLNSHNKIHKHVPDSKFPCDIDKHPVVDKRGFVLQAKHNKLKFDETTEFVCTVCNQQLHSQKTLQRHMATRHPSDVSNTEFSCETCGKTYPSKLSLQGHVRIHNPTEQACPVCHKQFHRPAYLRRHMLIHTDENPYRCPYCSKDFACQNFLRPHLRTHTGSKPYQCDVCGMRFTQQSQLMSHKTKHAPEKAFVCDDCGIEFFDNQELLSHITAHGREANKCKVCGKVFGRMKHMQKHMEIHSRDRRQHKCKYCDNTFLNKSDCRIHESIHTGDKAFSCEYCGKQFRHKSGLNYHIRTHTGERPYPCKTCGKSFRTNSYLHKHTMFHTGYRPYMCDQCRKGFTCKNDLVVHMRTHTGERPFACSICEKTFKEMTTMKKHVISMHTCSICGNTFRDRSDLGMHVMSHQSPNTSS